MKQAFKYSLKVWLTTIALVYLYILPIYVYHVSQPDHPREWALDPFALSILFIIINLFFLPAWGALAFIVKPIRRRFGSLGKQKAALNLAAAILVIITFSPLFIDNISDEIYYPLAGLYLLAVSVSTWFYKP